MKIILVWVNPVTFQIDLIKKTINKFPFKKSEVYVVVIVKCLWYFIILHNNNNKYWQFMRLNLSALYVHTMAHPQCIETIEFMAKNIVIALLKVSWQDINQRIKKLLLESSLIQILRQ